MCPLYDETGICMYIVLGLYQYWSSSMSGIDHGLENGHMYTQGSPKERKLQ